jgi:hypothetical protein
MSSASSLTILAAVVGSCAAALGGWLAGARGVRRRRSEVRPSRRWRSTVTALIVLAALAGAFAAPLISVLWALIALNLVLGRRENVPFSTYSMFSQPDSQAWALRFEDSHGDVVPIGQMGVSPQNAKKRFDSEVSAARDQGILDLGAARRRAAELLATEIEQHRPTRGPWAASPITIALIEYHLESGSLETARTALVETAPP